MKDLPTRDGKHVPPNDLKGNTPMKNCFYALRSRESKPDDDDDHDGKFLYFPI